MFPIFADVDPRTLTDALIPIIVVTLAMLIPIVAIITEQLRKRDRMRLVEKAIEHGIDPESLKIDQNDCSSRPRLPYRGGMVTLAVGIGLLLVGRFLPVSTIGPIWPVTIGGIICTCIGIALLLNDWMNRDRITALRPPQGPQV